METSSLNDMTESWIEVTPQSLGYNCQTDNRTSMTAVSGLEERIGLQPNVSAHLLERLLSEAQNTSDRASCAPSNDATPPSLPPSRDQDYPLDMMLERDPLMTTSLIKTRGGRLKQVPTLLPEGEWASRPDIGGYPGLPESPDSGSIEVLGQDEECQAYWSLRHSSVMKSRILGWLLNMLPRFLSHAASFLLGAVTMFMVMRKRVNKPKLINLPLD